MPSHENQRPRQAGELALMLAATLLPVVMLAACSAENANTNEGPAPPRTADDSGAPARAETAPAPRPGASIAPIENDADVESPSAQAIDAGRQIDDAAAPPHTGEPPPCPTQEAGPELFPDNRPYKRGRLQVSERHNLYWELVGNPEGTPLIVLHGGPGGRAGSFTRQFFDPTRFKTLLFDQRGAGRSRPVAEYRENTTQHLVEDINRLREHLGFEQPAILFGNSWGSTLALAYAEAHPEKVAGLVLGGVFLCTKAEIDHFYHGGTAPFYPKNFERLQSILPHPERLDYPAQLFEMITSGDARQQRAALSGWARYEIRMTRMDMTDELADRIVSRSSFQAFSTLENHYMMNGCFLEEGQLLRDTIGIAHIPTSIVNGRHDAICPPKTAVALARRFQRVKLEIVPFAAHSGRDAPLARARLRGLNWVAKTPVDP